MLTKNLLKRLPICSGSEIFTPLSSIILMSFLEEDVTLTRDLIPLQIDAALSLCISKYYL